MFASSRNWMALVNIVFLLTLTKVTGRPQFIASSSFAATRFIPDVRVCTLRGGSSAWSSSPLGARKASPVSVAPPQQTRSSHQTSMSSDRADTKEMMDAFLTRDSRQSFISRVYAILSVQLAVTALSVFLFGTVPGLTDWIQRPGLGPIVPVVSLIVSTIAWFTMCASPDARRKSPLKWKLLAIFTAGEAISVGFITSFYEFRSVMSAMLATAIATISVSLYVANQKNPKYDLSQWGSGLSS
jgi:FtsH-binding integral membrane protein